FQTVMKRGSAPFVIGTIGVGLGILGFALGDATVQDHRYIHMTIGITWMSVNLFLGLILYPVANQLDEEIRGMLYAHLAPKLTVFLPTLLIVAIGSGLPLAIQMNQFPNPEPWLAIAALVIVIGVSLAFGWQLNAWRDTRWQGIIGLGSVGSIAWVAMTYSQLHGLSGAMLLTLLIGSLAIINGMGLILAGNIRICSMLTSRDPDYGAIATIGQRNVYLARIQVFLLVLIVDSVVRGI
ncbi:MAG: hypothetical protein ABEI52_08250, partial [Halobacteriaceae archaeon]